MAAAEGGDWPAPESRDGDRVARLTSRSDREGRGWTDWPGGRSRLDRVLGDRLAPAVTFASTEHFTLQTARGSTVAEANGRASIYVAALSANLVALALIGQVSQLGPAFHAFALILLPALGFVGVVTFKRLVQCSVEDIAYAQRIGRLRDFYVTVVPELEPHVLVVRGPHAAAPLRDQRLGPSGRQLALTTAGMVAVINSVLIGACAGVVVQTVGIHPLAITLGAGAAVAAAAQLVQARHHRRTLDAFTPEAVDRAAIFVPTAPQDNTT